MTPITPDMPLPRPSFAEVLAAYEEEVDAGRTPDRDQWLRDYPDCADQLRAHWENADRLKAAVAAPLVAAPPANFGDCRSLEKIGEGGIGLVYRVHDPHLDRDLAAKTLRPDRQDSPELARRFIEEARITGQLQHPGIAPVHALGETADGRPFFTMKLIRGRTLAQLLRDRTSPADDLLRFLKTFEQVCQTVAYVHSKGYIHRDLKPANIMVGAFGEVQVMDWGVAKALRRALTSAEDGGGDAQGVAGPARQAGTSFGSSGAEATAVDEPTAMSRQGQVMGTPAYMAPEQARGEVSAL